jgi:hypothetical protein
MLTRKHLRRSRRKIAAGALGAQSSLRLRLSRAVAWCPDEAERAAAAHALATLVLHGWSDAGWEALGVPSRSRVRVPSAAGLAAAQGGPG